MHLARVDNASGLDRYRVDLRTGFVDHHHGAILAAVSNINGDLPRDQVGGLLRIVLASAIESDRILEPYAIGNIEMKNRHRPSSTGSMPRGEVCSGMQTGNAWLKRGNPCRREAPATASSPQ